MSRAISSCTLFLFFDKGENDRADVDVMYIDIICIVMNQAKLRLSQKTYVPPSSFFMPPTHILT